MTSIDKDSITAYIETNITVFHQKRLERLRGLKLQSILKRKNPYLFRAKGISQADELVAILLEAHLSSQEETIFGDFLEGLAIFICQHAYNGYKSSAEGIDLEFREGAIHYIVAIKSGPNWGNSSQIRKMRQDFTRARKILQTSGQKAHIVAVNGCCYGKIVQDYGDYRKVCGQAFWQFVSGDEQLYISMIEPLGHQATCHTADFEAAYVQIINTFVEEFAQDFCTAGQIDWSKLLAYNSARV